MSQFRVFMICMAIGTAVSFALFILPSWVAEMLYGKIKKKRIVK